MTPLYSSLFPFLTQPKTIVGYVIRELLEMTTVCNVSEQKGAQALWGPCAEYHIRVTATQPHVLWSVGEVVNDPGSKMTVDPRSFQLHPQKCWLDCIEGAGKIKKHDSNRAPSFLQMRERTVEEEDYCILHTTAGAD